MRGTRKVGSLSHGIISPVQSLSFISPSIAYFIHRKYGSNSLVNLLENIGFRVSYNVAKMFEVSVIHNPQQLVPPEVFLQYEFDNADHIGWYEDISQHGRQQLPNLST